MPVSGTVTYQGKPLDHGHVVFAPLEGTVGPQAVGNIDSQGRYEMTTINRPGAVVGSHKITVHCRDKPVLDSKNLDAVYPSLIPERYSREEESPLKIDVPSQGITYDISLEQ